MATVTSPDVLVFHSHRIGALVTGNIADYPKSFRHGVEVMDPAMNVRQLEALGVPW